MRVDAGFCGLVDPPSSNLLRQKQCGGQEALRRAGNPGLSDRIPLGFSGVPDETFGAGRFIGEGKFSFV